MINEHFKKQIEDGAVFFYYVVETGPDTTSLKTHKDGLDNFPTNLEFVNMATESVPLFREIV